MSDQEYIWQWFWERIGNDFGVAGLMGNLCAESSLNPENLQNSYERLLGMTDREYTEAVDSGAYSEEDFCTDGAGYGLPQFTYKDRKRLLYRKAKERGTSIGDLETQLETIWYELGHEFRNVLNILLDAKSVREASDAVMLQFERPADQSEANQERRASLGGRIFNEMWGDKVRGVVTDEGGDTLTWDEEKPVNGPVLTVYKRYFYESDCYQQGTRQTPTGVQVHSTGANNPWLRRYVQPDDGRIGRNVNGNDHNHPGGNVCANAYIGKQSNGTVAVYEALPWDMRCWLSGSGDKGNANRLGYIGFEICEDGLTDQTYFDAAMGQAILLTAYLCQAYGLTANEVRDHAELHEMGLASNHGDITHWLSHFGKNMNWFRERVRETMEEPITVEYVDCDAVTVLYQARVDESGRLNIRSGPGRKYNSIAQALPGSVVDVLDDSNAEWWRVRQDSITGYAMSEYLHRIEPDPPTPPEPPTDDVRIPRTLAEQLYKILGEQLVVDARSGNISNIDYQ